jgi:hypothetical protein
MAQQQPPAELLEFQRAVLISFDHTAEPSVRSAASASLERLKQSEDGWSFCLQAFGACTDDQARFWCLQTVLHMVASPERYAAVPEPQRQSLRGYLVAWLQSKGGSQTEEQGFIKNKFAQLVVAVIRHDYPRPWLEIFPQLLGALQVRPSRVGWWGVGLGHVW